MCEDYIYNFFGTYLVKRGIISQDILREALSLMESSNVPLGSLASKKQLLDDDQIKKVLKEQYSSEKAFGRIAVDFGYLNEEQLTELLDRQAEKHMFLGQALMEMGHISPKDLIAVLNDYWRLQKAVNNSNHDLVSCAEDSHCLLRIIDAVEAAFRRFPRLPIKLGGLCQNAFEVSHDHGFLISLELLDGKTLSYWLGLPDNITMILHTIPQDTNSFESDALIVDAMWQLMDVIKRYVRTKLSTAGHLIHESRSRYFPAQQTKQTLNNFLLLRLDTPVAPCLLGYRVDDSKQTPFANGSMIEEEF